MNVLDRSIGLAAAEIGTDAPDKAPSRSPRWGLRSLVALFRRFGQLLVRQSFSSLTRRIIFLNIAGLLALVIGILYLSQFRAGLIDARVQSLMVQGEMIANWIAAQGTADSDTITIDPERLQELQLGESYDPNEESGL